MIVRILGEGQFDVPDDALKGLNDADDAVVAAIEAGDEEGFRRCLTDLHAAVHDAGTPLPDEYLGPSDLALPADDATLAEVRDLLGDDGLVPG
jgi:hypothetical protein